MLPTLSASRTRAQGDFRPPPLGKIPHSDTPRRVIPFEWSPGGVFAPERGASPSDDGTGEVTGFVATYSPVKMPL